MCSGPTTGTDASGLLQWSCQGRVANTFAEATIDGNDARVVDFFITIPAVSPRSVAIGGFAAILDGTDAVAGTRAAVEPWLRAWDGADASATFGSTTARLQLDQTWYSLGVTVSPSGT